MGLIQGVTEFIPVSSSGHLAVLEHLLGVKPPGASFEIALHMGTLVAVLAYYRRELADLLLGLLDPDRREQRHLALAIVIGSVPAAIVGVAAEASVESAFASMRSVGVGFLIGGTLMLLGSLGRAHNGPRRARVSAADALWVGLAQSVALLPGVSRSGSTISAGVLRGLSREAAAKFSFLLAIPVVGGAGALKLLRLWHGQGTLGVEPLALAIGLVSSAISGYVSIGALVGWLKKRSLRSFGWYCLCVGLVFVWL
ncbi:MAG: undecaprenyl-diphosphate phosphatase [Bacillota bacterium]